MEYVTLSATRKLAHINSETALAGTVVIDTAHWTKASRMLNGAAFKLYMLLAAQTNGAPYMMDADSIPQTLGFSFSSFTLAIKELLAAGYLIQKEKHVYEFHAALDS